MSLGVAIKNTLSYSLFFDFPLAPHEVHHWLNSSKLVSFSQLSLKNLPPLSQKQIQLRSKRLRNSLLKKKLASSLVKPLSLFPYVWFVGLTGSVAVNNATPDDDLDIFIITAPSTLWLVRPLCLLYFSLKGIRRNRLTPKNKVANLICPNLWLDYHHLQLLPHQRSLYTAHEVLQVFPLINKNHTYERFVFQNSWAKKYLANAYTSSLRISGTPELKQSHYKHLFYYLFAPLNLLFFFFQFLIMFPHKKKEKVSLGKAFFHNSDFPQKVLESLS